MLTNRIGILFIMNNPPEKQPNMFSYSVYDGIDIHTGINVFREEIIRDSIFNTKESILVSEESGISISERPITMQEVLQEKKILSGDYSDSDAIFFLDRACPPKSRVQSNCYSCENNIIGKAVYWYTFK